MPNPMAVLRLYPGWFARCPRAYVACDKKIIKGEGEEEKRTAIVSPLKAKKTPLWFPN